MKMAMNAAILCLAVCICDVVNMASMCSRSVSYIMKQPFSALRLQRENQGAQISYKKAFLLHRYSQNHHNYEACN